MQGLLYLGAENRDGRGPISDLQTDQFYKNKNDMFHNLAHVLIVLPKIPSERV